LAFANTKSRFAAGDWILRKRPAEILDKGILVASGDLQRLLLDQFESLIQLR
jgi:hypothetical protein